MFGDNKNKKESIQQSQKRLEKALKMMDMDTKFEQEDKMYVRKDGCKVKRKIDHRLNQAKELEI